MDEVEVKGKDIYLIEGKHSRRHLLPSVGDIKDGLIKMILFTNLEKVEMDGESYNPKPVLKLTTEGSFEPERLSKTQKERLELLEKEGKRNGFWVL